MATTSCQDAVLGVHRLRFEGGMGLTGRANDQVNGCWHWRSHCAVANGSVYVQMRLPECSCSVHQRMHAQVCARVERLACCAALQSVGTSTWGAQKTWLCSCVCVLGRHSVSVWCVRFVCVCCGWCVMCAMCIVCVHFKVELIGSCVLGGVCSSCICSVWCMLCVWFVSCV
jgi:hypothetical protein